MRVLLVEDTPRLAEAVAEILRKSGMERTSRRRGSTVWAWPRPERMTWSCSTSCCRI